MSNNSVTVKEAGPEELDVVVRMVRLAYEQGCDAYAIQKKIFFLDPKLFRAWIAYAGNEPAGLTTLQIRTLRWMDGQVQAGYWGNLYVLPEYRKLMVYPRLVFAMLKGAPSANIEIIYTGTRRPHVAEGHRKLGFRQIGTIPVLIKPLRPFRLVAKHKKMGDWSIPISCPLDKLYSFGMSFRRQKSARDIEIQELDHSSPEVSRVVEMMNAGGQKRISQIWTKEYFEKRFELTIDSKNYAIVCATRKGEIVAALLYCLAWRGNHICTSVIMDIVYEHGEDKTARALIAEVEQRAINADADCVLFLDGLGSSVRRIFDRLGYHHTNELYHMLIWQKDKIPDTSPMTDLANWRFAFSDHDAF